MNYPHMDLKDNITEAISWIDGSDGIIDEIFTGEELSRAPAEIWLPRQEDLQAMINQRHVCLIQAERFYSYLKNEYSLGRIEKYKTVTMGKLWLAFVMKENYGKIWDGEAWRIRDEP